MAYYTYIIQSEKDGSYYIGSSSDVQKRLEAHNTGQSRYTSSKMPWVLRHVETYPTKTEALKRERFLKRMKNKSFYQRIIDGSSVG